jgi:hypothetical protein
VKYNIKESDQKASFKAKTLRQAQCDKLINRKLSC